MSGTSNYKENIERMSQEDDFNPRRVTLTKCDYVHHRGDAQAIISVVVDNECCGHDDDNKFVNLCWSDAIKGYHDDYTCRCEDPEDGAHDANDLKFVSEIAEKVDA